MRVEQTRWTETAGWAPRAPGVLGRSAGLVLLFADTPILGRSGYLSEVRAAYPKAHLLGCSTAGAICGTGIFDDALVVTAVAFEHTDIEGVRVPIAAAEGSYEAGARLAGSLPRSGLVHVFVLSDGLNVNGSELVRGLTEQLPPQVAVTGGLSGDGERFGETLVLWDDAPVTGSVAALGFYGERLRVGCGSLGGWDPFGPERLITRSRGNVLYELDG
jgi:hypothetical protein